jgi:predicted Zn-dependent peptidase
MVSSWLDTVKGFLCVVMGTLPETRARAVEEVLAQVRAIAQDGIAPAELDAARRSLEDRLVRMRDRPEAWLEAVAQMRAAGRVWQHEELLGAIRDVRPEDVVRVAANAQAGVVFVLEPAR